jgi:hypothetical protein
VEPEKLKILRIFLLKQKQQEVWQQVFSILESKNSGFEK